MGWIYLITCTLNGKQYIGQTVEPLLKKRWNSHLSHGRLYTLAKNDPELGATLKHKIQRSHLYRAMAHHGIDNFKIEPLIEVVDSDKEKLIEQLDKLEIEYIKKYDTVNNGYNIEHGGKNALHSAETKQVIKEHTKEAFTQMKVVQKLRKHHDKLEGLPDKCAYGMANNRACYRVRRHPLVKDKCFYVCGFESEAACKEALRQYIINVEVPRE